MPELPQKKVGIVACSGEEMAEGTISRLAALKVLEKLRPGDTVTICLPLFLAGGEGDRAFAKFYPTIAVDGCEKRCAFRGTEKYSNTPAASVVITDLVAQQNLPQPQGKRALNEAGKAAVDAAADQIAGEVDRLLDKTWNRRAGAFAQPEIPAEPQEETVATCSCGSGIPIQNLVISRQEVTFLALPLIFQNAWEARKAPSEPVLAEIMDTVKIYNRVEAADESAVRQAVDDAYRAYWKKQEAKHG